MVDPSPPTCTVWVLAPGAGPSATLVRRPPAGSDDSVLLPRVVLPVEPSVSAVIGAVADLLGRQVTLLRATTVTWNPDTFDSTGMVIEVDVLEVDALEVDALEIDAAGLTFRSLHPSDSALVDPVIARASVADWLNERLLGWSDLRPPWSRPGWLAQASAWMVDRMREAGYEQPEQPRIHHLWSISVVLAADSPTGTAYLKCSGAAFPHEAVMTRALASSAPSLLPEVVAVDPERGWLLMRALPGPELGEGPEAGWDRGLVALAEVQRVWLDRSAELVALGAHPRPLAGLATWVEGTLRAEGLIGRLDPDDRDRWRQSVPELLEACARLDALGPGPTLVHGDFHPWNVAGVDGSVRVFDWTDAAVSHPFLDLVTYVLRARDLEVRRQLLDRYLGCWSGLLSDSDLDEAGRLALVVGGLHQVQTYTALLPTILAADRGPLARGDVHWMRRTLDLLERGLLMEY